MSVQVRRKALEDTASPGIHTFRLMRTNDQLGLCGICGRLKRAEVTSAPNIDASAVLPKLPIIEPGFGEFCQTTLCRVAPFSSPICTAAEAWALPPMSKSAHANAAAEMYPNDAPMRPSPHETIIPPRHTIQLMDTALSRSATRRSSLRSERKEALIEPASENCRAAWITDSPSTASPNSVAPRLFGKK